MFNDVAVPYLQDWGLWQWWTMAGLLAVSVGVAAGWRAYHRWVVERTEHWLPTIAVPIVVALAGGSDRSAVCAACPDAPHPGPQDGRLADARPAGRGRRPGRAGVARHG